MPANIYKLKDGTIGPGASTIANMYPSYSKDNSLMNWSHKIAYESTVELTLQAYKETGALVFPRYDNIQRWQGVRDSAGDVGTQVHELILRFLSGEEVAISDDGVIANCFRKFKKWWHEQDLYEAPLIVEQPFISEKLGFGGQPDLYIITDGGLKDIKTGSGIYDSHWIQLAGYDILLREHGYKPKSYQILWLPKDNRFDCPIRTDLRKEKKIFKHLLGIYQLRRAE